MRKSYLIWFILFIGICIMAVVTSGADLRWYVDIPSLVMVLGSGMVLSLGPYKFREIVSFFRVAFGEAPPNKQLLKNATVFIESLGRYMIICGLIGTMIGAVAILTGLDDPSVVAGNVSLAIITVLYGLIFYISIVLPFRSALKKKMYMNCPE